MWCPASTVLLLLCGNCLQQASNKQGNDIALLEASHTKTIHFLAKVNKLGKKILTEFHYMTGK